MALDLEAIEAREKACFRGPWTHDSFTVECSEDDPRCPDSEACEGEREALRIEAPEEYPDGQTICDVYGLEMFAAAHAAFIAHAREDIPALVAEVRRLHEALANERETCAVVAGGWNPGCDCQMAPCPHVQTANDIADAIEAAPMTDTHDAVTGEVLEESNAAFEDALLTMLPRPDNCEPPEDGPGGQDGRIATIAGLDWAGRKMRETLEAVREADELAQAEIAPLLARLEAAQKRLETTLAPLQKRAAFFESQIRVFATTNRDAILRGLGKAKTKHYPSGLCIAYETRHEHLRLKDGKEERERLLAWARANCPEAVEERWAVDASAVKRAVGKAQTPPGMERVPESEVLAITTEKDGTP